MTTTTAVGDGTTPEENMAGAAFTVHMDDDDMLPAFQTVIDVGAAGAAEGLTLVGGLMVAVHGRRAGVIMRRSTDDMDALVDFRADRGSLTAVSVALRGLGFDLTEGRREPAYRFVNADGRKVDIMVADHLPSGMKPRLALRDAFVAPAGQQAIDRRDSYTLTFNGGASVTLGVPDELGALVAKGAAFQVDQRDRGRHLDDAAVLFACVTDASEFDYDAMSRNDRRRLRVLVEQIGNPAHTSWVNLDAADRERGQMNVTLIGGAVS